MYRYITIGPGTQLQTDAYIRPAQLITNQQQSNTAKPSALGHDIHIYIPYTTYTPPPPGLDSIKIDEIHGWWKRKPG